MKKLMSIMLTLTVVAFMASCSEDDNGTDPNTNEEKTYYPMTNGDTWIYNYVGLDQSEQPKDGTETSDTVTITGAEMYMGQEATIFEMSSSDGSSRTTHMYKDGKKLFASVMYILPGGDDLGVFGDLPIFPDTDTWVLLADPDQSKWDLLSIPIEDYSLDYSGVTITVDGDFSYSVEKGSKAEWVIGGSKTNVQEYKVIYKFDGTFSLAWPIEKVITLTNHYWFAEGIGLVKRQLDPETFDILSFPIEIDGNKSEIDSYNVTEE